MGGAQVIPGAGDTRPPGMRSSGSSPRPSLTAPQIPGTEASAPALRGMAVFLAGRLTGLLSENLPAECGVPIAPRRETKFEGLRGCAADRGSPPYRLASSRFIYAGRDSVRGRWIEPEFRSGGGAHAPRVLFSAPSRKTEPVKMCSRKFVAFHGVRAGRGGASGHTRGACAPQLRSSD